MADNVHITAGTGTSIATDDCGAGGHAQIVKLAISTDGSATLIPAEASNGLDVDVTRLPALVAGTALVGDVGLKGRATGGLSIFRSLDLDESEEEIKGTAGTVYFIHCMNNTASKRYLKFYNATAANVTVGSTTPVLTFVIPTQGDSNAAGFVISIPQGLAFDTAITAAVTTALADADTGAPGANDVVLNVGYT